MLLRRRRCSCSCSSPLLLFGVAVCLFYQTLMVARNRLRSGQQQPAAERLAESRGFVSTLEAFQAQVSSHLPMMMMMMKNQLPLVTV